MCRRPTDGDIPPSEELRLSLFLRVWILTLLLEKIGRYMLLTEFGWPTKLSLISIFATTTAVVALFWPRRWWALCSMILGHAILCWTVPAELSGIPSAVAPFFEHWFLALSGHVILALGVGEALIRRSPRDLLARLLARRTVAPLRALMVVTLCSAGFAKLNDSFFTPHLSCATDIQHGLAAHYPAVPVDGFTLTLLPYLVVVVELLCPLLLFTRFRALAILLIGVFMFGLGLYPPPHSLYDFAGLYLALLVLFLPLHAFESAHRCVGEVRRRIHRLPRAVGLIYVLISAILCWLVYRMEFELRTDIVFLFVDAVWIVLGLFLLTVSLFGFSSRRAACENGYQWRAFTALPYALFLGVIFAKEALTYVGWQHRPSFKMASGLAVSRAYSNHFLVRTVPDLGFNRLATIEFSEDPALFAGQIYVWGPLSLHLAVSEPRRVVVNVEGSRRYGPHARLAVPRWVQFIGVPLVFPTTVVTRGPVGCNIR